MRFPHRFAVLLAAAPLGAQQAAFHVANYDLTSTFPDTGDASRAAAELTVVRTASGDTLVLDLLDLTVTRVTSTGKAGGFTQDRRTCAIARRRHPRRHASRRRGLRRAR